jgi:hypothetical protein
VDEFPRGDANRYIGYIVDQFRENFFIISAYRDYTGYFFQREPAPKVEVKLF